MRIESFISNISKGLHFCLKTLITIDSNKLLGRERIPSTTQNHFFCLKVKAIIVAKKIYEINIAPTIDCEKINVGCELSV